MSNADNPSNDEEQSATMPTDYHALLAMTRPLVVAERTLQSWRGGKTCGWGLRISRGSGDWRAEFILKRGEILCPDLSGQKDTAREGLETTTTPRQTDSDLRMRIYIGMS
jgi:hypothetical protein